MPYKRPFTIIAGVGLGACYSSLTQIGELQPSVGYGQAGIRLYANVANGNLVVRDHVLTMMETNGSLEFSYIYNSQAATTDTLWRFAVASRLVKMPETTRPLGVDAILLEVDGHETRYVQSPLSPLMYLAPWHSNGNPYLIYNYNNSQWERYQCATREIEFYDDKEGLLRLRMDAAGRKTSFEYEQAELTAVVGSSGIRYEIRKEIGTLNRSIFLVEPGRDAVELQKYFFDDEKRLIKTIILPYKNILNKAYEINYEYQGYLPWILSIAQTDQTKLSLNYNRHVSTNRIEQIIPSEEVVNKTWIAYPTFDRQTVEVTGYEGDIISLLMDSQQRLILMTEDNLYNNSEVYQTVPDVTHYSYAERGQLDTIVYPGGGSEYFKYEEYYGLLKEHGQANGKITEYDYNTGFETPQCIAKTIRSSDGKFSPLLTRFVYEKTSRESTPSTIALRFIISPENRVTEHRVNTIGQIITTRCYLEDLYNVAAEKPTIEDMYYWIKRLKKLPVTSLSEFSYDSRGQQNEIRRYADVSADGSGIDNAQKSLEVFNYDAVGHWVYHSVRLEKDTVSVLTRDYDELERITQETNVLGHLSQYSYADNIAEYAVTMHDSDATKTRVKLIKLNDQGLVSSIQETVSENSKTETRLTKNFYDILGHPIVTILPDNRKLVNFWDYQQRPILFISVTCHATLTLYDRNHNYQSTIRPSQVIKLVPKSSRLPDCWEVYDNVLIAARAADTRYSYLFYDQSQRTRYSVDTENYCIESLYDTTDRLIGTIHYADKITDAELAGLKNQQSLARVIDTNKDRWHSTYFDGDNNEIATIDPAGWVTETVRDVGGRAIKTILYHTPMRTNNRGADFNAMRPASSEKDAITYQFYNAKNKVICSVDANGYVTVTDHYANDLIKRTITYYQKVDSAWLNNPVGKPPIPEAHLEDATQDFTYNALNQLLTTEHSNQRKTQRDYDQLGQLISQSHFDKTIDLTKNNQPDFIRGKRTKFDGWNQVTRVTNPYIAQKMIGIEYDSNLTPEQKQETINALWANESTRNTFDPVTGLLCSVSNSINFRTIFYYDDERRLLLTLDALGKATEHSYTPFSEIATTRNYSAHIPMDKLMDLTGGFITAEVRALLIIQEEDLLDNFVYDKRGTPIKHTDPAGYISEFTPNAFKEKIIEKLPVDSFAPSITITHTFNPLGQEICTVHSAGDLMVKTSAEFENPHGHITKKMDGEGGVKTFDYDSMGNPICLIDNDKVIFQNQTFDAQNRVLTSFDAFNAKTEHSYIQATRSHQIKTPVVGTTITTQTNVFKELVKSADALGYFQTITHDPDGQIARQQDKIGRVTQSTHNSEGWLIEKNSAIGVKTLFGYNAVGIINKTVLDTRTTLMDLDDFYRSRTVTNPRGVVTKNSFDKHGSVITSQIDSTLNLLITKKYNGQRVLIEEMHGDTTMPDQYHVTYQQDALGRSKSKIIDPISLPTKENGLQLTTMNTLDKMSRVVKHVDQKGATYRLYYDLSANKRFKVSATGGVIEWRYDAMARVNYHAMYERSVLVDDQTNLTRLEVLVNDIADAREDKVTHRFRDANGDLRFSVKLTYPLKVGQSTTILQGIVTEHQVDANRRETRQCIYATLIDATNIETFSTSSLEILCASIKNIAQDRTVYKFYNPAGDGCFSINAMGKLHEDRFDAEKRITRAIDYATPIRDIDAWLALSFADFKVKVSAIAKPKLDQFQCYGFDAFGKALYTVNAMGKVIRFSHDECDNLTHEIHFDVLLMSVPLDDEALKALVMALKENPAIDRIKLFTYNAIDAQLKIIDSLGHEDSFERDALSNITSHQDREGQKTLFEYDRAKRQVLSHAPAKMITTVALTPDGKLGSSAVMRSVKTKREYDNNNNLQTLIADFEGDQQRSVTHTYTPLNRLQTISVSGVSVDDPSKPASLNISDWPIAKKDLVKTALYNAKGLLIVEVDECNHYRFKVYDNQNRLRFLIAQENEGVDRILCSVIGYEYNAFGDKVWETNYATLLPVDIHRAKEKGLKLSDVVMDLYTTEKDRVKWYDYNQNSEWTHRVMGISRNSDDSKNPSSFYYNPATQDIGTHYRLMQRTVNVFGLPELISTLISPNPETWQHQRIIYDQNNNPIIESVTQRAQLTKKPGFHVKITNRNAHQEIIETKDFYTLCSLPLNEVNVSYEDVINFYLKSENQKSGSDKIKTYTYTLQGKKASRTLQNVTLASLELSDPKNPSFKNQLTDAVERFSYNAIEKLVSHQLANGASEYHFRNAAGDLIAHAAQPRKLSSHADTAVVPLKLIGVNAHGQAVSDSRVINGATMQSGIPVPNPVQTSPDDQVILKLMDSARGLNIVMQNARGIVNASTFTATKQKAREWQALTTRIMPKTIISETAYRIDARGRTNAKLLKEDHALIQATYKQFNSFGDEIFVGPDNANWPLYREQDNSGRTWKTNENRVPTVFLHDLRANVTAEMVAQVTDVKALNYDQLIPLIKNDPPIHYEDIEITLSLRDENSRILQTILPRSAPSLTPSIKNIPLQVSSFINPATLSWGVPTASNMDMAFSCWTDPITIHRLPIQLDPLIKGRCFVDVSALVTNIYDYRIDYSLKPPVPSSQKSNAAVLYQTTGIVGIISVTQNGQRIVASVRDDHILYLAGVNDLVAVTVQQDLKAMGTFPLTVDKGQYWADLSSLVSGSYSASAENASGATFSLSLPFIINTVLSPNVPLAREIPAISQLMTLNQYGQLILWQSLPKDYQLSKVSVRIHYIDQTDAVQQETFVIDPTQPTAPVEDSAGHSINANITFKAAVKEIKDCDIQLIVGNDLVMLYQRVVPTGSQNTPVTHVLNGRRGSIESTTVLTHSVLEAKEPWHAIDVARKSAIHQLLPQNEEITDVGADLDPTLIISWSCPPVRIAWIRGLAQTFSIPPTISYLDVSADHLATWKDKAALAVTQNGIVLDVTGFPAGNYPYIFEGGDKAHPLTLSIMLGENLYSSVDHSLQPPDPTLRHIDYTRDVRGNAVAESKASGAEYDRIFTLDDQLLTEAGPVISVQDQAGNINDHFRPVTQRLYDIRGLAFGLQMPAGNLDVYVLNAAGDKLQHLLGDGTVEARFSLDGFGRAISRTLANGAVFSNQYSHSNKLIRYIIPNEDVTRNSGQPLIHAFAFNELDIQDQHLDAAGNAWQMDLDSRNNPLRIKTPTGVVTELTYGRDNFLLRSENPLYTLAWLPDPDQAFFGVIGQHTDAGGCVMTYDHNKKGEVIAKRGVGGKHGNMTQLRESTEVRTIGPIHHSQRILCDVFTPVTIATPPVNIEFRLIAGRLMSIKDNAQQIKTEYSYDTGDRPTMVTLRGFDDTMIHAASAVYNALGDETQIYNDSLLNAVITYDENRNVRRKLFDVSDQGRALTSKMDHGFTYDRADRALIIDGAFTDKGVVLQPDKGFETTYVNHQRTCESRITGNGSRETFDYTYWQSGELRTAQLRDTPYLSTYYYHASGYQRYREGSHKLNWRTYLKNTTDITADAALFQTKEVDYTAVGHYYEQVITTLTPALDGRTLSAQSTQDNNSQSNFSYGYQYNSVNFEAPQTTGVSGWTQTRDGRRNVSSSITHDSHGTVNGKWGVSDDKPSGKSEAPRLVWYVNGEDGTAYQKWYLYSEQHFHLSKPMPLFGIKNVYFYSPRGAYLGSYQNQLPSTLGAGAVSANLHYHMPTSSGNIAQFFNNKADRSGESRAGGTLTMAENVGRMMTLTTRHATYDFRNHHKKIHENWAFNDFIASDGLSPVPQVVTVKTGDTYDRLAENIYGTMADASVALAESAGEAAGVVPQVGSQIVTPQFIVPSNTSTDHVPLSRVQQYIQGTLLPHLTFAQPHQNKGKCSDTMVRVAIDIIAVSIAYASVGTASSVSIAMIEGAAVAAASDALMQEVAINVGLLQSFSWQEVMTTGIAGAMSAGFSGPAGVGGVDGQGGIAAHFAPGFFKGFGTFARLIQLMVFAGVINIMDQLALIAVGKRQGFDVKELLITIVEAGIAYQISTKLSIANSVQLTRVLNEVTDDVIDAFVGSAIMGGSAHIETAMAQAIGATIGNSIGDHVKTAHSTATEVNSSAATQVGATKALTNLGPMPDSSYYTATAAATGVGANASAAPASDLNDLLFGGLDTDAHDFAISVMSNSHKPVTSVNQNSVRPFVRTAANASSIAPARKVANAQSSVSSLQGVLNRLGERFENLVVYGKFNTNQEEASYIGSLAKAYKTNNRQFTEMLRNNSPVSGTVNVLEGLASSGSGLLRKGLIKIPGGTETTAYHSVTSASNGQSVLNGIDFKSLNSDSRFGKAFYLSANPDTTLAELAHHNAIGVNTIRYDFNSQSARVLDLTMQPLANIMGYRKGVPYEISEPIAQRAIKAGFNAIRYPSARGLGENIAVFNNFERLLTPKMIVPTSKEFTPEFIKFNFNRK